jgi:hypothetical protein
VGDNLNALQVLALGEHLANLLDAIPVAMENNHLRSRFDAVSKILRVCNSGIDKHEGSA